mmetsp:Transcript_2406/g.7202  ORF Transcript_2406/g.7202 Transcript_2406/m.7202 type:complete len:120 (+) Transcript_2406:284-643(+)
MNIERRMPSRASGQATRKAFVALPPSEVEVGAGRRRPDEKDKKRRGRLLRPHLARAASPARTAADADDGVLYKGQKQKQVALPLSCLPSATANHPVTRMSRAGGAGRREGQARSHHLAV